MWVNNPKPSSRWIGSDGHFALIGGGEI